MREAAAQTLSTLLLDWVQRDHLDDTGRQQFFVIQQQLIDKLLRLPPHKQAGCANCPVRCQVLSIVAPHLSQLEKSIVNIVTDKLALDTRIERLRTTVKQIYQIRQRYEDPRFTKGILYCLLTNAQLPSTAQTDQQELLAMLL